MLLLQMLLQPTAPRICSSRTCLKWRRLRVFDTGQRTRWGRWPVLPSARRASRRSSQRFWVPRNWRYLHVTVINNYNPYSVWLRFGRSRQTVWALTSPSRPTSTLMELWCALHCGSWSKKKIRSHTDLRRSFDVALNNRTSNKRLHSVKVARKLKVVFGFFLICRGRFAFGTKNETCIYFMVWYWLRFMVCSLSVVLRR